MELKTTSITQLHTSGGIITTEMQFDNIMALYELCKVWGQPFSKGGRKVSTIRLVRETFGCGLREAKAFVDDAAGYLGPGMGS